MDALAFLHDLPNLTKFALTMAFFLRLPRLAERLRLPGIVGFLLAGVLLGPQVLGILKPGSHIVQWFSDIGKLLLMFFAGFEVDLQRFREMRRRSLGFGAVTFLLPFLAGFAVVRSFDYGLNASVLVGSLLASHTLLGFPIVKRLGLSSREAVLVTIGATVMTDILAMLILAVCLRIHQAGFSTQGLIIQVGELAVYVPIVLGGLSWVARRLLESHGNTHEGRVTVLFLLIAVAAQLAEAIHLEGIIGAFLAGVAVKRAVRGVEVEENLDVMSQTFFIPAFFLTTGFLIDFRMFGQTVVAYPLLVVGIVGGLLLSKYLAASLAGRAFGYDTTERRLMWSLTTPQVAATLAAAVVAFKTLNPAGQRLIDEPVINTILVLVIVTAVGGTVLTGRYAERLLSAGQDGDRRQP
ncbi:MAG: cation:proton antiporter [Gammaproteobacteria bacterium]